MTVLAGAFCLKPDQSVPQGLRDSLTRNLRCCPTDAGAWHVHNASNLYLVKWDSCAFSEPAWRETSDASVCTLVGDPLLIADGDRPNRECQMARLAPTSRPLDDDTFAQCRGSFALVRYVAAENSLQLATDAVGLRSIYYLVQDGLLIFSTALRVLEAVPEVRKKLSLLGMAELSAFSFPLAERTPYEGITMLRECQILTAATSGLTLRNYYDWANPEPSSSNPNEAAAHIYGTFQEAVRIRVAHDKRVYSFLSGGMDSRAIVAALVDMGREVEALNFSAIASQDQRYAQRFADEVGSKCRLHCLRGGHSPNFSFLALAAKTELEQRESALVDRPQLIWSGDGGSVGLGHVYMDEGMLSYADRGEVDSAVKHFFAFNRIALPTGVLTGSARRRLPQMLFDSVMEEVNRYPREDVGRRIYLFLLFNDQRRHLFKHFETIDQHGIELLLPFYDSKLLKAIAATPARWGILHRLYVMFLRAFPGTCAQDPLADVPWPRALPFAA